MSGSPFATGHCLCGKVRYTISAPPVRTSQCHCEDCRRLSGTGHASNAFFKKSAVNISGETHHYDSIADTGATITRHFCPHCGSRLFGTSSVKTDIISVTAGTMDDSSWFQPDAIVYNKSKPVWDQMDETVPTFEEMPPIK
ncbi:MAG: GFA family protein [Hydrogenovibrio sp.]|nr:GFA family protein [Hydrogenovibrio sp.]